jgi:hypothetical protein
MALRGWRMQSTFQRKSTYIEVKMTKLIASFALVVIIALGLNAQGNKRWASARERGLRGKVHILVSSCSDMAGNYETRYTYEFDRSGKLIKITSPTPKKVDCIVSIPVSHKVTKRNDKDEIEEVSSLIEGSLVSKEKYEYEYDAIGNWVKQITLLMRTYEMDGGDWKTGEWKPVGRCRRAIEYYP